jgi:hypothetical protein
VVWLNIKARFVKFIHAFSRPVAPHRITRQRRGVGRLDDITLSFA